MGIVDDTTYGVIQYLHGKKYCVRCIASEVRLDHQTVRYWLSRPPPSTPRPRKKAKKASRALETRRKHVARLVTTVQVVEQVRLTAVRRKRVTRSITMRPYSSPSRISRALAAVHKMTVSASTVRRDLAQLGYRARKQRRSPLLTPKQKEGRLVFCKDLLRRGVPTLLFTDEKQIDSNQDVTAYQWVAKGQLPDARFCEQGPAQLTLWGAVTRGARFLVILPRTTINREVYRTKILQPAMAFLKRVTRGGKALFQQDNARPHCGALEFLTEKGVTCLDIAWPPCSCDANVIETVWAILDRRVKARAPFGVEQLEVFVREEWDALDQVMIDRLVDGFEDRHSWQ